MIDGAAAAGQRGVVEPARTVDAEDGAGALPATRVAWVIAISEALGKGFKRLAADLVEMPVVPAPDHGRRSPAGDGSPRQTLAVAPANQAILGSGPKANAASGMNAAPSCRRHRDSLVRFGLRVRSCTGIGT